MIIIASTFSVNACANPVTIGGARSQGASLPSPSIITFTPTFTAHTVVVAIIGTDRHITTSTFPAYVAFARRIFFVTHTIIRAFPFARAKFLGTVIPRISIFTFADRHAIRTLFACAL
jgi:hypothetical protein